MNLVKFRENQADIALRFAVPAEKGIEAQAVGYVHLIPVATHSYLSRYGIPTKDNLENHCFIDTDYYAARTEIWSGWREALDRGHVAHFCDNSYAYAFMVKSGLGIGLMGNYTLSDPNIVPLDLGVHIKLPLYLLAESDRLNSKPVRVVYDWLAELFGTRNPWFAADLTLGAFPSISGGWRRSCRERRFLAGENPARRHPAFCRAFIRIWPVCPIHLRCETGWRRRLPARSRFPALRACAPIRNTFHHDIPRAVCPARS